MSPLRNALDILLGAACMGGLAAAAVLCLLQGTL